MATRAQSWSGFRRLPRGYVKAEVDGGSAYLRLRSLEALKSVDAVVFDCDGVLIDARRSYDAAIRRSIQYIFSTLTGCRVPLSIIPKDLIYTLRMSGGFNFDWDTTYVLAAMIFANLPRGFQRAFLEAAEQAEGASPAQRLLSASSNLRGKLPRDYFKSEGDALRKKLTELAKRGFADREAAEEMLLHQAQREGYLKPLKGFIKFLNYPSEASRSIVSAVFDEYFYGSEMFRDLYGFEGELGVKSGLIERERRVVTSDTLRQLTDLLGEGRLGLATGRGSLAAKKTLGDLLNYFNGGAMVFLEDLKYKMGGRDDLIRRYAKPEPYSLLQAASGLGCVDAVLYVGNSSEDFILARKANSVRNIFLFAGCYALQGSVDKTVKLFAEADADMILPTVNDLPKALKLVGGGL